MTHHAGSTLEDRSSQEIPTLHVPGEIVSKARLGLAGRQDQAKASEDKYGDGGGEEQFRILEYPPEPWGRASRNRSTVMIPSRRLISSLIEDIKHSTDSQDSTGTTRHRRNRRVNPTKRVSLKRARSPPTATNTNTDSSDDSEIMHAAPPPRSHTSLSTKMRQPKQHQTQRRRRSPSDTLMTTTTTTTRPLLVQRPISPRKPRRVRRIETTDEDEEVDIVAIDDQEDDTSESDFYPEGQNSTPRPRSRVARARKRSLLLRDEDEDEAIEQEQEYNGVVPRLNETEQEQSEVEDVHGIKEAKAPYRIIERVDCVLIPVVAVPQKRAEVKRTRRSTQPVARLASTRNTNRDTGLQSRPVTTKGTTAAATKSTTARHTRMVTKKDTNTAPVLDLDAKKETRANARRNANAKPEPTESVAIATAPPPDAQELSRERKGSLRQAINVIEPPRPPSLAESRAKVFHGWWLKRRNNLMQDDSIGILVQGNILEPKAMAWHTSTIKDAPEPTLVMTFTGSFYRLQGSIDAEKMEGNGFPQDVIKAFRNGFPANWKTVLGKGNEQGATSNAPAGKGSLSGKEHNAASQAFIKPSTQQERVSTRSGESTQLVKQEEQTRRAKQEEQTRRSRQEHHTRRAKEQTQQVKQDAVPPRGPGGRFKRAGMSPIDRASVRHSSVSPSLRVPTTVPSVAHVPSQLEAIVIPVVDSKSRDEGSQALSPVQSVTARGTPNKAPTPSKSSTLFKTPTLARESTPVSEQKGIQEQAPILRRASMPLRASTSSGQAFSQGEGMVPRRESAPGQSRTGPEPVRSVGEDTGALDIPLDGNLRMRSKAVMDQLMEHTRQQSNPSPKSDMSPESDVSPETNPVKEGGESGQLPQQSLQDFGGSSKTTLLPLAKSLSSISGSSRSLFGDLDDDLSMFVDLDSIDQS